MSGHELSKLRPDVERQRVYSTFGACQDIAAYSTMLLQLLEEQQVLYAAM